MNRFAKVVLRSGALLAAVIVMQRAACASVDDAQSFALQTAGRKAILRLRTSFQRPPAVTLSLSAWSNRQRNARIGRWCMVSGRVGLVALAVSQSAIGEAAGAPNCR